MNPQDDRYLQNAEIARIFRSGDAGETGRVFGALESKFKRSFFKRILLKGHHRLADETLENLAVEAFNETLRIFYDNLRNGAFDAEREGLSNYLYSIFFGQYMNYLRKELSELDYRDKTAGWHRPEGRSETLPMLNGPGGLYKAFRTAIARLPQACQELMTDEGRSQASKNNHRLAQQRYACSEKLKRILRDDFGLRF